MAIDLPKRVDENIDRFNGRAWLLPHLLNWWDKGDERLFLLTGGPGTGKSMVMAWLAGFGPEPKDPTAQTQLTCMRKAMKAAHFCQAASRNITPQAFADNIANQLTGTVQEFGDALAATLAERVQIVGTAHANTAAPGASLTGNAIGRIDLGTLGDELSFDRAFTQPLTKLYASGHGEPMLLLVDALDEAQTYTGVTLPDLLSRLSDLPAEVRILATTRDEPRVLKFFHGIKPFDLIKDADPDVDDVRTYAEGRLANLAAVEEAKRKGFATRLALQAGGVFLFAAMVLDELLERPLIDLPDLATYPLPDGLSGLYHDFLTRELGKDEQRWFDLYEPLLGLIAVAQGGGLTTEQLTAIIGKDTRVALRASKQYLSGELPEGPFRPFHKSFADFLLEEEDNVDYHIDAGAMHARVTKFFAGKYGNNWLECDDRYALEYVTAHLMWRLHASGYVEQQVVEYLGGLLTDLRFLERKTAVLGIFSVLADISAACRTLGAHDTYGVKLAEIGKVLDSESHHLNNWKPSERPGYFVQQVLYRAERLRFSGIALQAAEILRQRKMSYLRLYWASGQPSRGLLRTLVGHRGKVWSIAVVPDGKRVISAGDDGTLRVWRFDTGEEERTMIAHAGRVRAVSVTLDGRYVVSAGADNTVKLWDINTGQLVRPPLEGHGCEVLAVVALIPDGLRIASGDAKGFLRIWDLQDDSKSQVIHAHSGEIRSLAVMADTRRLVSASSDRRVRIWSIENGELLETLEGDGATFRAVTVSSDQRLVFSAASDGSVKVWDLADGNDSDARMARSYRGHHGRVRCVALTDDGRYAISGGEDRLLKIWDTSEQADSDPVGTLQGHSGTVWAVATVPISSYIISGSEDGSIKIWDWSCFLTPQRPPADSSPVWPGHSRRVQAIAASADGSIVISGAQDGTIRYWNAHNQTQQNRTPSLTVIECHGHANEVTDLAIRRDDRLAISASRDKSLKVWNLADGSELRTLKGHRKAVSRVLFVPGENCAVSAADDGTVTLWNIDDGTKVVLHDHGARVLAMVAEPNTNRVISAGADGAIVVITIPSMGPSPSEPHQFTSPVVFREHKKAVLDVAVTSDGRLAVSASADGLLKVQVLARRDVGSQTQSYFQAPHSLVGHDGPVLGVAVTPNGKRAVSISSDNSVRVWDMSDLGSPEQAVLSRKCSLIGQVKRPIVIRVTTDNEKAVTISADGQMDVWDIRGGAAESEGQIKNVASVSLEHALTCLAVVSCGNRVVVGDRVGDVACFELVSEHSG